MKKILITLGLLLAVFVLKTNADVCIDSVASDGTRYLYCSFENTNNTNRSDFSLMAINCIANKKDTTYILSLALTSTGKVFYSIPKNGRAYIKDITENVDSLISVSPYEQRFVRGTSVISPEYVISKNAISLIKRGIIKIRLEMSQGYYDIKSENFNTGALQKQILELDKYLKGFKSKVDLLKDF